MSKKRIATGKAGRYASRIDVLANCKMISAPYEASRMPEGEGKKETPMNTPDQPNFTKSLDTSALPAVVNRATWQAELAKGLLRDK